MAFDINVIIDFSDDVKAAIAAALAAGPRLPPLTDSDTEAAQAEPKVTNGGDSPKPRGRRPRAAETAPNISTAPEDRKEPEAPSEPQAEPESPLAAAGINADATALKKLMLLLAAQTDRDKAVGLMTEYAATAPESFSFTNVSAVPPGQLAYMVNSILEHVDLDAKKGLGLRFLKGEVGADEVMIP